MQLVSIRILQPLISCGVIKLASAWDGKAAQLGGFFTSGRKKNSVSTGEKILGATVVLH
jgi:hypothetical protein